MIQSAPYLTSSRTALRMASGPSTICTPSGTCSSHEYPESGYIPVGAMARVATNMRGPGITPRAMAVLMSTSAYMAPSVSTSRKVVKPFITAVRAAALARRAR